MPHHLKPSAIILAAGFSERFGYPKAFLRFNNQQTFLDKLVEQYKKAGIKQILFVINEQSLAFAATEKINLPDGIKIIINEHPEYERFYSIMLGVKALSNSSCCFIQNVDSPFINAELLIQMVNYRNYVDYFVPVCRGRRGHPVLINKKIIEHIGSCKNHDQNLRNLLSKFKRGEVEIGDDGFLRNINAPEDYDRFFY